MKALVNIYNEIYIELNKGIFKSMSYTNASEDTTKDDSINHIAQQKG
jgi:hypothetical protein